jgi:hypothetical protein
MYGYTNGHALCGFGAARKGHTKLVYNDAAILLTMAIADNVLVAVKSVKEALAIPLGEDELPPSMPRVRKAESYYGNAPRQTFIIREQLTLYI